MVYRLAEKRCGNFGTCTGTSAAGMSQVNDALFKTGGLFAQGRDLLHAGTCSGVRPVVDQIVSLMTVPLVHACDAAAAKVVSDNMKFGAAIYTATTAESDSEYTSGTKPDTGAVKAALEKTYSCLGITCAHVGG